MIDKDPGKTFNPFPTPLDESTLKEQGEQNFIERLLNELAERANLPTGDWDTEDDPAEYMARCIAFELRSRDEKIVELQEALKPRQYDCYWSRRALQAEKKIEAVEDLERRLRIIYADAHFIDVNYLENIGLVNAAKTLRNIREKATIA